MADLARNISLRNDGIHATSRVMKYVIRFLVIALPVFVLSCMSARISAGDAKIEVVTHPKMVEGLVFVTGWQEEVSPVFDAQEVGNAIADDLATKGYHDVWVLVEIQSRAQTKVLTSTLNIWLISVYQK